MVAGEEECVKVLAEVSPTWRGRWLWGLATTWRRLGDSRLRVVADAETGKANELVFEGRASMKRGSFAVDLRSEPVCLLIVKSNFRTETGYITHYRLVPVDENDQPLSRYVIPAGYWTELASPEARKQMWWELSDLEKLAAHGGFQLRQVHEEVDLRSEQKRWWLQGRQYLPYDPRTFLNVLGMLLLLVVGMPSLLLIAAGQTTGPILMTLGAVCFATVGAAILWLGFALSTGWLEKPNQMNARR